jgi:YesN/AraC family two-component response regulator
MNKVRLLIVEDHETVREGLKLILAAQTDIEVIAEAGDGHSAIEQAKKLKPDVVLMDISLPKLNGL